MYWIGASRGAATRAILPPENTKPILTNAQSQTGFDQHPRIRFEIILHAHPAKLRSLGEDLIARATAKLRYAEHMFPR